MVDMESKAGRRIVGRIDMGASLEEALLSVCRKYEVDSGEVRVNGILRDPVLLTYREEDKDFTGAYRIPGVVTLVGFQGDVTRLGRELILNAKVMVAWDDRGQPRMAGGHLKSAKVYSVEFVIESFDDLIVERGLDPETRLPVWANIGRRPGFEARGPEEPASVVAHEARSVVAVSDPEEGTIAVKPARDETKVEVVRRPSRAEAAERQEVKTERPKAEQPRRPAPEAPKPLQTGPSNLWEKALSRSIELDEEEDEDDIELMRGDVLIHPKFGECKVLYVDDDERVWIRRPGGGKAALAMSHIRLKAAGSTKGGQAIYSIRLVRP